MADTYDPKKPYFIWSRYQDTHGPYHPPEDKPVEFTHPEPKKIDIARIPNFTRERRPNVKTVGMRPPPIEKVIVDDGLDYVDRYDEELAYADFHIKRLLDAFEEKGLLKNTLVIFSADQGESMMDHENWFTHGYHVYEEITRIPLLIRYPDQKENVRVQTRVSLVDLLPTIFDIAGIEAPAGLHGKPLSKAFAMEPLICSLPATRIRAEYPRNSQRE